MTEIAVTGSTGHIGGLVARTLAGAGLTQRLLVRDPSRAPELPGATVAVAEYRDAAAARGALSGVEVLLMVSGSEAPDRLAQQLTFVDAAVAAGVRHVVYTSFYGAAPDATFTLVRDHWATERHIRASGLAFTFLRDNLYADFLESMFGPDGVIRGPGGTGRAAVVAQRDVAEVAALVLRDPGAHAGRSYDLTGPEALTLDEVATTIGGVRGRALSYYDESLPEAFASRAGYGAPEWQVEAWVSTYTAIAAGELAGVSQDIPRLLGRPATSLAQIL